VFAFSVQALSGHHYGRYYGRYDLFCFLRLVSTNLFCLDKERSFYQTVFICPVDKCGAHCIVPVEFHWFHPDPVREKVFFSPGGLTRDCLLGQLIQCAKCSGLFEKTCDFIGGVGGGISFGEFLSGSMVQDRIGDTLALIRKVCEMDVYFDSRAFSTFDGKAVVAFEVIPFDCVCAVNLHNRGENAEMLDPVLPLGEGLVDADLESFFGFKRRQELLASCGVPTDGFNLYVGLADVSLSDPPVLASSNSNIPELDSDKSSGDSDSA